MTPRQLTLTGLFPLAAGHALGGVDGLAQLIGDLPEGKAIIITHEVRIAQTTPLTEITSQGQVTGGNFTTVPTDDPDVAGAANPTVTPLANRPPVANSDEVNRHPSQSVKIPVSVLLANDTDPDGNVPLSVTGVSYTSGNGADVFLSEGTVFYDPRGFTGTDTFDYTLQDSLGADSTGTVTINAVQDDDSTSNITSYVFGGSGANQTVEITGAAIPGRVYRVQAIDPPDTTWFDLSTVIADALGRINFTDGPADLPPARIYRVVHP